MALRPYALARYLLRSADRHRKYHARHGTARGESTGGRSNPGRDYGSRVPVRSSTALVCLMFSPCISCPAFVKQFDIQLAATIRRRTGEVGTAAVSAVRQAREQFDSTLKLAKLHASRARN